jgi:site-specific recombinase XerC
MEKVKAKDLLEIDNVRRWYENIKAKSTISADIRLRSLAYYCNQNNVTPMDIVKQAKSEDQLLKKNFEDFVRRLEKEGLAGSYIAKFKTLLKSWLKYNDVTYPLNVNIIGEDESPTTQNEQIPLKDELKAILRQATMRGRVAIAVMSFSGVRPEVLGNYEGSDGLTLGDLEDFDMKELKFTRSPSRIIVRSRLSKARHQYFTFIGGEGQKYIEEYLLSRKNEEEELSSGSPLLQIDLRGQFMKVEMNGERLKLRKSGHAFLRTMLVTRDIREAIRSAGLNMRPYVLRAYFITQLDIAENKRLISHPWRLFFEGHKGDISARYSVNKGRLPPDMVEDMREAYAKCLQYLETEEHGIKEEDFQKALRDTAIDTLMAAFGISLTDQQKEELYALDTAEYQKRLGEIFRDKKAEILNNGNKHKTIPEGELEKYLNKGWELVQIYPKGDKAVIKLP